ncbi:GNAT family N-acetyltransferase [Maritalea mediterranea]|uniref:GNAT family N-acetyltransferase n=1 Tax=Maritalea mediterranea TaxID=2909667 RepID=A0ABS9E4C5_9HYPH|nr:GNAT family N-acetyltransferase [Maritalea mediterranea]MCF4097652.1 GNAT family N-acetyltransferase [Maritalea mediterranea]
MSEIEIRDLRPEEWRDWARMRGTLFEISFDEASDDVHRFLAGTDPNLKAVFCAASDDRLIGFVEISERSYADGCYDGPVAYMEGWYIDENYRGTGVGKALVQRAIDWAKAKNYPHLGSDAELRNTNSQKAHQALGFEEIGRIVQYRMALK